MKLTLEVGTMAPVLFNLYFAVMLACHCPEAGVAVRYRIGRRLVGERTAIKVC